MMLPSHLLAVLLLGQLAGLARGRPLAGREWGLALGFGVAIDLDHALALPAYVAAHGAAALSPGVALGYGAAWQGVLHTPWALALVLPATILGRSALPALAWGLHMAQDFVVARHFVVWGSAQEWLVVAALAALVAAVGRWEPRLLPQAPPLARPAVALAALLPRRR